MFVVGTMTFVVLLAIAMAILISTVVWVWSHYSRESAWDVFCARCGHRNPRVARFCAHCGINLG